MPSQHCQRSISETSNYHPDLCNGKAGFWKEDRGKAGRYYKKRMFVNADLGHFHLPITAAGGTQPTCPAKIRVAHGPSDGQGSRYRRAGGCPRTKARVYWCSMCFSPLTALLNASFKNSGGGKSGKPWPRFTVEYVVASFTNSTLERWEKENSKHLQRVWAAWGSLVALALLVGVSLAGSEVGASMARLFSGPSSLLPQAQGISDLY